MLKLKNQPNLEFVTVQTQNLIKNVNFVAIFSKTKKYSPLKINVKNKTVKKLSLNIFFMSLNI